MKLTNLSKISGRIILQSGLHIGAGDTEMHIGGTDNPVVTHPHTREPYIPGSSLKGKVRSLLEMRSGMMIHTDDGKPLNTKVLKKNLSNSERAEAKRILKIFGVSGADGDAAMEIGPTRASFADCPVNKECGEIVRANNWSFTEVKSENSIDRIKGTAQKNQGPRFIERVPAGMIFDFCITIKEMEGDENLQDFLLDGLKLLELDALGGSGSRGYGRVRFELDDEKLQEKFAEITPIS
ncbi:MAG: type III-A CRISPR-associated RAMP protein Csm3 [Thermodesulfobacteriota bacterium]|nr:type III-A CRISPR-associated RAMP protein Csm3 [Thermodesulfobacteriota bacterium]